MSRLLLSHAVNPANDKLEVEVHDEPGAGGACNVYTISGYHASTNPGATLLPSAPVGVTEILFQNGPIAEVGVNGITHEALLAILIDRLEHFERGPFACKENERALVGLQQAQYWLHQRTKGRMDRGVEGTHKV